MDAMIVSEPDSPEATLARELLASVLSRCTGSRVRFVAGSIVDTEPLDRDSLTFQFEAQARDTPADGAQLELELVRLVARCERCGHEYLPTGQLRPCPCCGCAAAELLQEAGVQIRSIEVE